MTGCGGGVENEDPAVGTGVGVGSVVGVDAAVGVAAGLGVVGDGRGEVGTARASTVLVTSGVAVAAGSATGDGVPSGTSVPPHAARNQPLSSRTKTAVRAFARSVRRTALPPAAGGAASYSANRSYSG